MGFLQQLSLQPFTQFLHGLYIPVVAVNVALQRSAETLQNLRQLCKTVHKQPKTLHKALYSPNEPGLGASKRLKVPSPRALALKDPNSCHVAVVSYASNRPQNDLSNYLLRNIGIRKSQH